ncbi:hypothetical protein [Marinoscillum furvescens]|nr:hypothetical protein [Marinoscillum furvescens]
MRNFFSAILLALTLTVWGQYIPNHQVDDHSDFYLDLSSGIDNHSGLLGIGFQLPLSSQVGMRAGFGFGSWGGKLSIGMKYQRYQKKGWGYGLGYSHCPGIEDIHLEFTDQNGNVNEAHLEYLQVGTLNFTINRNWTIKDHLMFFIESGYAVPIGGEEFYRVKGSYQPNASEKALLQVLRPGGLIFAVGLLVGL